jgi:hypothetical protein
VSKIESLPDRDRGFVLNRIAKVYFGAKDAKEALTAVTAKQGRDKSSKGSKNTWKKQWEESAEYKAWQAHIKVFKDRSPAERESAKTDYEALRASAFRVRDEIRSADSATETVQADPGKPPAVKRPRGTPSSKGGKPRNSAPTTRRPRVKDPQAVAEAVALQQEANANYERAQAGDEEMDDGL